MRRRWPLAVMLACAGLLGNSTVAAHANERAQDGRTVQWRVDLDAPAAEQSNVAHTGSGLTLASGVPVTRRLTRPAAPRGTYTAPETKVDRWVSAVRIEARTRAPRGTTALVEVRGRDAAGAWTQWREAGSDGRTRLPRPVASLQTRVSLEGRADGTAPSVSGVTLAPWDSPAEVATASPATASATYRLFATREGLVGGTTANGHVIKPRDHFVALPSRRMLASDGGREYTVRVCNGTRCETAPVWDVGPWNTRDDYWSPPSVRQSWNDLPQGKPEAQAAYENGYNGGRDEFGRQVANPAGIDLADGTFWDGLGMTDNGWVNVTFQPSGDTGTTVTAWADANVRSCAWRSCGIVSKVYANSSYPAECWIKGEQVTAEGVTNDKWVRLPLATGGTGYVSGIYLKGDATGGVTTPC
ncbi:SH3 domain-containing protein [Streptomyces bambusae]|uniref:SH3 domain-containing protein n=1 Tax=Streptomyces bambusae TaxID=1550616 RepID=UPI001CFDCE87|nr:SH3 domain-containing protein [Streptomyces bambusae]MCB5163266.1 SH3 domain-containing protein [Streptomyces bambusae]